MEQDANTKSVFNQVAQQYQEKYRDLALYEDGFDLFCSAIEKKAASVLEIACGPGNVSHYLLQQRPDFQLLGIDFAEQMIELARIAHPTASFQVGDAREICQLAQQFDGILCGFGLPYLSKPEALTLIREAAEILWPEGILYLSTMEDNYMITLLVNAGAAADPAMPFAVSNNDASLVRLLISKQAQCAQP